MNDINLTQVLMKKMNGKARVRGRYNSSELFFIINGKTTPEEWMNAPARTPEEVLRMWNGIGAHAQLEDLLGKEHSEKKVVYPYKDLVLVAKGDFFPPHKPDEVWEWKTSEKLFKSMKDYHAFQVKLYTTMFEKKRGSVYQPVQDKNGLYLKHLGTVERDDKWFMEQLEKLYEFHLKVEKLWEKKLAQ